MKKNGKRLLSKVMALTVALSVIQPASAVFAASNDIGGHWAEKTISSWESKGLIKGYEDGSFQPDRVVTRAEFVKLTNQVINATSSGNTSFSDVNASDWFYNDVKAAVGAGYATGFEDGTFRPNETVTRAQAATFISRATKLSADEAAAQKFSDYTSLPSWAAGNIGAVVSKGYMNGYPDTTFKADNGMTRAEAVATLDRVLNGASEETDKPEVKGENVTISKSGETLKDVTVDGDLIVSEEVGNGNVTIDGVTVKGDLIVNGGGSSSVTVIDTTVDGTVIVNKADVRIVVKGDTEFDDVSINEGATITADSFTGTIGTISIDEIIAANSKVVIAVPASKVAVNEKAIVRIEKNVSTVTVDENASGSKVEVTSAAKVSTMTADGKCEISGSGQISKLNVNVNGVSISSSLDVSNKEFKAGVSEGSTSGGGGSSSSDSGDSTKTDRIYESESNVTHSNRARIYLGEEDINLENVTFNKGVTVVEGGTTRAASSSDITGGKLTFGKGTKVTGDVVIEKASKIEVNTPIKNIVISVPTILTGDNKVDTVTANASLEASVNVGAVTISIKTTGAKSEITLTGTVDTVKTTGTGSVGSINLGGSAKPEITVGAGVTLDKMTLSGSASANVTTEAGSKVTEVFSTSTGTGTTIKGEGTVDKVVTAGGSDVTVDTTAPTKPEVVTVVLESIQITTLPAKTKYYAGETVDASGIVVTGNYKQGDTTFTKVESDYTVSPTGTLKIEDTVVTVTVGTGTAAKTAQYAITVRSGLVESVHFDQASATVEEGKTVTLKATVLPEDAKNKTLTWASKNTAVATVDQAGVVTGVKEGVTEVTATSTNGISATALINVTKVGAPVVEVTAVEISGMNTVQVGDKLTFESKVTPTNATVQTLTWKSSDEAVATVSNGLLTALKEGKTTITATSNNGKVSNAIEVTVSAKIVDVTSVTLNVTNASVEKGKTTQLTATVNPAEATDKTVVWSVVPETVATVDQTGLVTGVSKGEATVTATAGGKSATCAITVTESGVTPDPTDEVLESITAPEAITDKEVGTAFEELGLPTTVAIVTTKGATAGTITTANVAWTKGDYNSAITTEQTIKGTVTLPTGVVNTNSVPLTTTIKVTLTKADEPTTRYDITVETVGTTVKVGNTIEAKVVSLTPAVEGVTYVWSSSNNAKATVAADAADDKKAKVTGVEAGSVTITVKAMLDNKEIATTTTPSITVTGTTEPTVKDITINHPTKVEATSGQETITLVENTDYTTTGTELNIYTTDAEITFTLTAKEVDATADATGVTWSVVESNSGVAVDPTTGAVKITNAKTAFANAVTITATKGTGDTAKTATYTVKVSEKQASADSAMIELQSVVRAATLIGNASRTQ